MDATPEREGTYFDRQEVRPPAEREQSLLNALPGLIRHALDNAPLAAARLGAGFDPDAVTSRAALAALPVLRKSDLAALQRERPPFGGLNATPPARLGRVFASPGPIYDPEGNRGDYWRFGRALYAAGFRPGRLIHNSFSYHLTPAGMMVEGGARALGCPVVPGGTGQTELQLRAIDDLRPDGYAGTPSFLLTLLAKARELGLDTSSIRRALVSGEAFPPALCSRLRDEFGVEAYQCYATADLGLIAYETEAREGLVLDESLILEVVRPGTGDPVPEGEVGEVVVTAFNPDYPLLRFATGDLSAVLPGESSCGRTNTRLRGWLGRADQTTKVRGMFVHPAQVEEVRRRHGGAGVGRARLVVEAAAGGDEMSLLCEVAGGAEAAASQLATALAESARGVTGLRARVELVAPGSLPNDGKVIDDRRPTP